MWHVPVCFAHAMCRCVTTTNRLARLQEDSMVLPCCAMLCNVVPIHLHPLAVAGFVAELMTWPLGPQRNRAEKNGPSRLESKSGQCSLHFVISVSPRSSSIMSDLFPCQDDALHMAMDCCILRLPTQPMHLKRNHSTPTPQVQTTLDNQGLLGPLSLFWFKLHFFAPSDPSAVLHICHLCHVFVSWVSWVLFVRPWTEVVLACPSHSPNSPKGEH